MSIQEYKVVLAGEFGSGRSTFASRFTSGKSATKKIPAIKTEIIPVKIYTSAGSVTITLYDTLVHAKGGLPEDAFFRTASAALLFFDTTKKLSYEKVSVWYEALQKANGRKGSEPLPVILVGTKVDDVKNREVKPESIDFAQKLNLPYIEISSKANYNVRELLLKIIKSLLGASVQLTDKVELEEPSAEVDPAVQEEAEKAYADAAK
ncbi:P-loop containing nucleoside triphosphate hydrolase protein [Laetiporus sulphureus 93-53]|uniref:p-loop containing nucleoside triphosphate hydrolase protein n=1 Tax=Laetiporus sulphureus 93-53 TaxID=1314785 RepID=A0A165BA15_9APHY|nr:P-loop containing nucleoside triphosphate hydrolase protein [Laetiporus sulphureus 93-53]KZT00594.1 P-loop containing nucleoside triphosphate hydrolase protein [Laetiporus sulphureus 93-53]